MHDSVSPTVKRKVAVLILGGGRGTRLYPLTLKRSKPAVPFAGRYRLVDIALSRCIHARLLNLHVLTQYNSASLHLHINRTYRFDAFNKGGIQVLAASQFYMQDDREQWFLGSADAVRKTLNHYSQGSEPYQHFLILAGDQIHELDVEAMLAHHLAEDADFTIAGTPIHGEQLSKYGVLKSSVTGRVSGFLEKPSQDHPELPDFRRSVGSKADKLQPEKPYWGSMGSYLIRAEILRDILREGSPDFGSGAVPYAAHNYKMMLYPHLGFFEDIGVFETFFDVHIRMAEGCLPINLYHSDTSLYTYRRELPPAMFSGSSSVEKSLVVEGSVMGDQLKLKSSLVGVRSIVQRDCSLYKTYLMGNDFYPCHDNIPQVVNTGSKNLEIGIGANCRIANAIIDKNCSIGSGCRIGLDPDKLKDGDYQGYSIHKGIVIIPKGSVLPSNTII
ncbi:sugar phosphate nucleotidyltransferase [Candidatus Haliotispira prima]|uniref:Sugar phosphate nucleotidyltransferase n=1 Tax=Candidatus Haliotispira prima TaxID=3034016 RepID=A0ABY8MDY8_9SPIO|nr:sugar phosphate nucleotidyltransferase [Candidatus Haliotispira prima]